MTGKDAILIVDDDAEIRRLLKDYLANQGYQAVAVSDGREMWQAMDQLNETWERYRQSGQRRVTPWIDWPNQRVVMQERGERVQADRPDPSLPSVGPQARARVH